MKRYHNGSALLISLMFIISILSILYLSKDKFIQQQNITDLYSEKYLSDKQNILSVHPHNKNEICQNIKQENIHQSDLLAKKFYFMQYQFSCQFNSLFKNKKPTKEKYIQFTTLTDYLDLSNVPTNEIFYISSLSELPSSSENNPRIVITRNDINENLPQNFYGIIITAYYFDITGKKMYGTLYSSYDNAREERNLTFKKEVLAQLENKYSYWNYLEHSENMLGVIDE